MEQQGERTDDSDSVVGAVTFETSILLENILRKWNEYKIAIFSSSIVSSHNLPILEWFLQILSSKYQYHEDNILKEIPVKWR